MGSPQRPLVFLAPGAPPGLSLGDSNQDPSGWAPILLGQGLTWALPGV